MTLQEAVQVFDSITPLDPEWFDLEAQNAEIGKPKCCGLPVVMTSRDGRETLHCLACIRTISRIASQWYISNWGAKGLKLFRLPVDDVATEIFENFRITAPALELVDEPPVPES